MTRADRPAPRLSLPKPVDLLNATVRLRGLVLERGIAYGPHRRHRFDLYRPAAPSSAPASLAPASLAPVLVFLHGGSWQSGARGEYRFLAARFAAAGYLVAVPDYRLHPEAAFPEFLEDCARATGFILRAAASHGGDPERVFLMGHSAGAYNALMLALDPGYLARARLHPSRLAGVIGLAGPYDFLPIRDPVHRRIFAPAPAAECTQPIHFASERGSPGVIGAPGPGGARAGAPPILLLTGAADRTVLPRNTAALAARLRAAGAAVESRIYPRLGHAGIVLALLPWLSWRAPVRQDCLAFMAACRDGEFAEDPSSGIPADMAG